ncbi:sensor histidine kinase [bacterium M00.F.Ca.ET.194.01.1.1]|nr:sensor histidine kinase [bacterium M00.F.Ca.ET.194.01.1.1]TGS52476.1 sensor histidine kinase [bacterium M00.F.Ca.ET.179.01.1.1]TGV44332.1 sensor histidine kinase [bacterium M00.F.Ca.ET.168.01.1.1]
MNGLPKENGPDWVLVLAPFRKDAEYIAALLQDQKVGVVPAKVDGDLEGLLCSSPDIIIVTHEALTPSVLTKICDHLNAQPDWSEIPIIVLLEKAASVQGIRDRLQAAWPKSRLLFHVRPIAPLELVNAVQLNLLVRLRQRQVRNSIERERELRLELNHRVKNILATVTSIFQMTRKRATTVDELAGDFGARLQALSGVHSAVFEAGGEEVDLSLVVATTIAPYNGDGWTRIAVSGPDIVVGRDAGTTIALCIHELTTNAIKYGALSVPEGSVEVVWEITEGNDPMFSMNWVERGGPPAVAPSRQGYGTRYIRSALGSLFGTAPELQFGTEGFRCCIAGPVSQLKPAKLPD